MKHPNPQTIRQLVLAAALLMALVIGLAPAQTGGGVVADLTQSTHVTYAGVDIEVEATWVTPAAEASLLASAAGDWSASTGIVMLVHESTTAAELPSAMLGSASVLAVEGQGVRPEVIGLVETHAASRVTLLRFPVTPDQTGKIALNLPGKGVLVWNVGDCLGSY